MKALGPNTNGGEARVSRHSGVSVSVPRCLRRSIFRSFLSVWFIGASEDLCVCVSVFCLFLLRVMLGEVYISCSSNSSCCFYCKCLVFFTVSLPFVSQPTRVSEDMRVFTVSKVLYWVKMSLSFL